MEEPRNIKAFNFLVLYTLNKLYHSFPEGIRINPTEDAVNFALDCADSKERDLYPLLFTSTLTWLQSEGFISMRDISSLDGAKYDSVRLTLKGLTLLGYSASSISEGTLVDQIQDVISDGFKASATEQISKVIGGLFNAAMGTIA